MSDCACAGAVRAGHCLPACAMRIISRAISSGESTKSIQPLAMALSGISGWLAVFSFCAMVMPPLLLCRKVPLPRPRQNPRR